jgi:hypothetical protein
MIYKKNIKNELPTFTPKILISPGPVIQIAPPSTKAITHTHKAKKKKSI